MIEKVPLDNQPEVIQQRFGSFAGDLMLDALENKQKLRSAAQPGEADVDDEQATVEREVTRMLSERRPDKVKSKRERASDEAPRASARREERRASEDGAKTAAAANNPDEPDDGSEAQEEEGSDDGREAVASDASSEFSGAAVADESDDESVASKKDEEQAPVKDKKTLYREEREDLLWQLKKLERCKIQVPVVDNCTSLEELRRIIKDIRRESLFDSNINSLKTFLITVLHGVEWVGTQQLGLNLTGFAEHEQLYKMDEYDRHLIALSDRSYLGWSEGLPPEFAILIALITNTSLYLLQNKKKPMKRNAMQGPSSLI